MDTMIQVNELSKEYDGNPVLTDITLSIQKGEFVAIMGQSGCGKSTLLYNMSGMDVATSGNVLWKGKALYELGEKELSRLRLSEMGFVFQRANLLKNLNIEENILFPGLQLKRIGKQELQNRADMLLREMGIEGIRKQDIKKVSGGQLQRAAICRALINEPEVLFGDEPTGALNAGTTREILELLDGIHKRGTTIVLVTHDANVAVRADRVIYLADGNVRDEMMLGTYEKSEEEGRHGKLLAWLQEMGF